MLKAHIYLINNINDFNRNKITINIINTITMSEEPSQNVPNTPKPKAKRVRSMTPELLEKLKLARERAAELRAIAKEAKSKLPDTIPEKERTKVAQYLATRKAIKDQIKHEIVEEIESSVHEIDAKGFKLPLKSTDPPPPLPVLPAEIVKVKSEKVKEPESDSDDEYTIIKVPKKKLVKWNKKNEAPPAPAPLPEKPKYNFNQHLINLKMTGYNF